MYVCVCVYVVYTYDHACMSFFALSNTFMICIEKFVYVVFQII